MDESISLREVWFQDVYENHIRYVAIGPCMVTETNLLVCTCTKCTNYRRNPNFFYVTIDPPDDIDTSNDSNTVTHHAAICIGADDTPSQAPPAHRRNVLRRFTAPGAIPPLPPVSLTIPIPDALIATIRCRRRPPFAPTVFEVCASARREDEQLEMVHQIDCANNDSLFAEWANELTRNLYGFLTSIHNSSTQLSKHHRRLFVYQLVGFLKESKENRAVTEYQMFYFPPTTTNGDPIQAKAERNEYLDVVPSV